jgi:TfoX/Sxy family transcriptional regulator of competence genes
MARPTRSSRHRRPARAAARRPAESSIDPRFAAVIDAFARDRRVTSGKMMASLGLRVGGKIFAMLVRGELVVKLPGDRVSELVGAGLGRHFDPRRDGRLMREWLVLAGDDPPWVEIAREAYAFVGRTAEKRR